MGLRNASPTVLGLKLNGTPVLLGTIVATTTKNNHDTAVPFNNTADALKGKVVMLVPDAACYVTFGTTNAITATTAGVPLQAGERVHVNLAEDYGWIACVSVSGTTNLRIWEML